MAHQFLQCLLGLIGPIMFCMVVAYWLHGAKRLTEKDVSDGEVDEQVVAGGPGSPGAGASHQEEEVAEDRDGDGHHV